MKKYTFTKENHQALVKAGYEIHREGYNSDGDVVVEYYNQRTITRMGLVRPDDESYTGIVPKWESEIEPQDEAMDAFRRLFSLITTQCKVSRDGKVMVYPMTTLASAARWASDAQAIITANQMPLKVKAGQVKKDGVVVRTELRIIYQPK